MSFRRPVTRERAKLCSAVFVYVCAGVWNESHRKVKFEKLKTAPVLEACFPVTHCPNSESCYSYIICIHILYVQSYMCQIFRWSIIPINLKMCHLYNFICVCPLLCTPQSAISLSIILTWLTINGMTVPHNQFTHGCFRLIYFCMKILF